jgi:hypothetical protein
MLHEFVRKLGLVERIDRELQVLKMHRPYRDSDHVLNIAFNALCGGQSLEDIENRRNDVTFLDALGARTIPDPTTAGDFCRRFASDGGEALWMLQMIFNDVRADIWKRQRPRFREETARIDADGTFVTTTGACKEGMDINYKREWGFHALLISLANTSEPLFIYNRPGNRPSYEGAAPLLDQAITLARRGGFKDILLRGDTDFTQTAHLDRWDDDGVRFVFGYDANKHFVGRAQGLEPEDYVELVRRADEAFEGVRRARPRRVKDAIIKERGYKKLVLKREDLAEFEHQPSAATKSYRIVALRKDILVERGQLTLGHEKRYFFYVTNDREMTREQVVRESNDRCNQERLIDQLKNGVRAFRAPLDSLLSNAAYMVMSALAWSIKAWFALSMPISNRWREAHEATRSDLLRMEFATFVQRFVLIPAQVLRSGRRPVIRFLAWRPDLPTIFRFVHAFDDG